MAQSNSDFTKLQELQENVTHLEEELEAKMDRWEFLSQFA